MKRGFTLLLAEDNENEVLLFRLAVEQSGRKTGIKIRVHIVRDGEEAIAYLSGEGAFANRVTHPFPDLIVMDLKMPLMTGLDVLRWLSEHPEYRRIPKILLSGSGEDRDVEEAYDLGVNTYFQKPNQMADYCELVHQIINYWAHTNRPVIRHVRAARLR